MQWLNSQCLSGCTHTHTKTLQWAGGVVLSVVPGSLAEMTHLDSAIKQNPLKSPGLTIRVCWRIFLLMRSGVGGALCGCQASATFRRQGRWRVCSGSTSVKSLAAEETEMLSERWWWRRWKGGTFERLWVWLTSLTYQKRLSRVTIPQRPVADKKGKKNTNTRISVHRRPLKAAPWSWVHDECWSQGEGPSLVDLVVYFTWSLFSYGCWGQMWRLEPRGWMFRCWTSLGF